MKKIIKDIISILTVILLVNIFSFFIFFRWDFTKTKRYSLSKVSKTSIRNNVEPIVVDFYVTEDLPQDTKKLVKEFRSLLKEYKSLSNVSFTINTIYPDNTEKEFKATQEGIIPSFNEIRERDLEKIQKSDVLERLGLEKDKYILLSAHREENIDSEKNFLSLFTAINALAEKYDMPILYSCHPRSKHRLEKSGFQLDPRVRVNEPLGFNDYNKLQMNALAIVSDSGTLPEESSFYLSIGHPIAAVCIRTSTERPEALDKGNFILAGITTEQVLQAVDVAVEMNRDGALGLPVPNYVDENVSVKVVKLIQSYTGVVNKMVWRKY